MHRDMSLQGSWNISQNGMVGNMLKQTHFMPAASCVSFVGIKIQKRKICQ